MILPSARAHVDIRIIIYNAALDTMHNLADVTNEGQPEKDRIKKVGARAEKNPVAPTYNSKSYPVKFENL